MPVQMKCPCGKVLRVPDEHVGKKVKCPGCGQVQLVTAQPASAPAPRAAAASPGMIRFSCPCGRQMQAKAEHAGAMVQCPGCGEDVEVPGGTGQARREDIQETPSRARGRNDDFGFDREEEEDRPRRRGKSRNRAGSGKALPWILAACGLLLLLGGGGFAIWYFLGGSSSEALALVPANAEGFVTVRVADLWESPTVEEALAEVPDEQKKNLTELEEKLGLTIADIERVTVAGKSFQNEVMWVVISTKKAYDLDRIKGFIEESSREKLQEGTYKGKNFFMSSRGDKNCLYKVSDTTLVIAPEKGLHACIDQQESPVTSGPLAEAISTASGRDHLVAAFAPSQAMLSQIPDNPGPGGPAMNLASVKKLQVSTLVASLTSKLDLDLTLTFTESSAAEEVKKMLDGLKGMAGLFMGGLQQEQPEAAKMAQDALNNLKIEHEGEDVVIKLQLDVNVEAIKPVLRQAIQVTPIGGVHGAATRARRQNNLKQLALAMHIYHDAHGGFPPPVIKGPNGQPLHSWRVALLPYLEQDNLYRQIRLDEPWDSPHNSQFHSRIPSVFADPGLPPGNGLTRIQVFVGDKTPFPNPMGAQKIGVRLTQVLDGSSNTIMMAEHPNPVPWMAPRDRQFAPSPGGLSPALLGIPGESFFLAAFCDGSVRAIPKASSPMNLQNMIILDDGNPVDLD